MTTLPERLRKDAKLAEDFAIMKDAYGNRIAPLSEQAADAIDELVAALEGVGRTVSPQQFAHAQELITKYKAKP
jgi:hypothetical protein